MLIELTEDLMVRVPEEKLPLSCQSAVFHTFKAGTKGNYSSENRGTAHRVHRFCAQAPKHGFLTYTCVTELRDPPSWL